MIKIFVSHRIATKELLGVIRAVETAGYDKSQAFVGNNFNEFTAPLKKGDKAVVYSLTTFGSVSEILATTDRLSARGIDLCSVAEPWFNDPKIGSKALLAKLFELAEQLHAPEQRTRHARKPRPMAARTALAHELRATKNLTVADACHTAGCSVSAYYTHRSKR